MVFQLTDIDECTRNTDNCDDVLANCTNTEGGYNCTCIEGYDGDGFEGNCNSKSILWYRCK